jgi:hypothetical protein
MGEAKKDARRARRRAKHDAEARRRENKAIDLITSSSDKLSDPPIT